MFVWPRRWVRRQEMRKPSGPRKLNRSVRDAWRQLRRRPRRPRIRRRLPYTGARAAGCFDQSRRPLSGSDT